MDVFKRFCMPTREREKQDPTAQEKSPSRRGVRPSCPNKRLMANRYVNARMAEKKQWLVVVCLVGSIAEHRGCPPSLLIAVVRFPIGDPRHQLISSCEAVMASNKRPVCT